MRGQSALAYLVMVAAVLTIAVTAVVIFQSMLSPAQAANLVLDDKYQASMVGIELIDYQSPYAGSPSVSAPSLAVYNGEKRVIVPYNDLPQNHGSKVTEIGQHKYVGKFKLNEDVNDDGEEVLGLQSFTSRICEIYVDEYGLLDDWGLAFANEYCNDPKITGLPADSDLSEIEGATAVAYSSFISRHSQSSMD